MRPVRELPVAFPDLVAGPSHQGVLRQRTKDLIHFPQVHIALPQPPPALREPRNRPQVGLRRPGQVKVPHCCSESNSATSDRSEEHTSELQSLMRISYAVFCLKKKNKTKLIIITNTINKTSYTHKRTHININTTQLKKSYRAMPS